ncbi:MAG: glutathione-disulfide reductase [Deltaproteobacteria bacterium]|nr:MAG: glutathione-disulfide reductase [Deltaproteobacteria bacterium]
MTTYDVDLLVIGAGSGGVRCARIAAGHGARVAVVEASALGGTCVNLGCVPKKLYMTASRYGALADDALAFGWQGPAPSHRWSTLREAVAAEVRRLNGIYGRLLDQSGCTLIRGYGRPIGPHQVQVGDQTYSAARILLATGGEPTVPPIPGAELGVVSDALFDLRRAPERVVIVGGGYIGVEFACIFRGLGAQVSLVNKTDCVLTAFDHDVRDHLATELTRQGIALYLGRRVSQVTSGQGETRHVRLDDDTTLSCDLLVFATGRRPRTRGLGLEELGVALDDTGGVIVDGDYRSSVPSIFAIGDVTGGLTLTPVATAEGHWLADHWFSERPRPRVEYDHIPTAVFSRPNVATVGLTEAQAAAAGHPLQIYKGAFRPLSGVVAGREERTLVKLVVCAQTARVLGLHMVGDEAGEVVQGFAVALKCGAKKEDFDRTIGIHPTVAEEFVTLRTPVG